MAAGLDTSSAHVSINVAHLEQTLYLLGTIDPQLRTALDREIKHAMSEIAAVASSRIAGHGSGASARGYRVERRRGGFRVRNVERGAAIAEFAGSVNPDGRTPRGQTLIRTLSATWGKPGRLAWAAFDETKDSVFANINAAIEAVEAQVNARMGRP